jgi:hypothetical protein
VCEADAVSFRHQAEQRPITVEAPGTAGLHDLETRLVVPVEDLVRNAAVRPRYTRVSASDPCQATLTTVTRASGRMPRTTASGWRSSSFNNGIFLLRNGDLSAT